MRADVAERVQRSTDVGDCDLDTLDVEAPDRRQYALTAADYVSVTTSMA